MRKKKERLSTGRFYIEGIRLIGEALRNDYSLESILFSPELLTSKYGNGLIKKADNNGIELIEVSSEVFKSFAMKDGPQGIAGVGIQKQNEIMSLSTQEGLWIALENVQDPGNLGTILRSLDGAGGTGMFLVGNCADAFHPTAVRSSMGAIFSMQIIKAQFTELRTWKNDIGAHLVGTICQNAMNYRNYDYPDNMVLVMGSEQKGLSNSLIGLCDQLVNIPMGGSVDSLNLSNAASIMLF
ncbi:MAG: RNA methyltransferase, partial [Anaerolineaceae bacterium]|nr:RNA methyltransferase [Anaerolineaceae bacterium]